MVKLELAVHSLGGHSGPLVVIFHANSLCARVYEPLAARLVGQGFRCVGIDWPGQGSSPPWPAGLPLTILGIAEAALYTMSKRGITDCYVLGHSMGGAVALAAEQICPGTFRSIWVYEPVVSTQLGLAREAERQLSSSSPSPGNLLATMARKRRSRWPSRQVAAASLGSKPPFSKWDPDSLAAYIQYGLRPVSAGANSSSSSSSSSSSTGATSANASSGPLQSSSSSSSRSSSGTTSKPGGGGGEGEVELSCSPSTEESVYLACEPPFTLQSPGRIQCPVLVAAGGSEEGDGKGDVHSRLPVLGHYVAQELPRCRFVRFKRLSHFGPQEDPGSIAQAAAEFFLQATAHGISGTPPGNSNTSAGPTRASRTGMTSKL